MGGSVELKRNNPDTYEYYEAVDNFNILMNKMNETCRDKCVNPHNYQKDDDIGKGWFVVYCFVVYYSMYICV